MVRPLRILWVALCISAAAGVPGQGIVAVSAASQRPTYPWRVKALAAGKLLVASRSLLDPNFAQRVVLLVDYGQDGAAGLVVNVRTDVPLSRAFGHLALGTNASHPVYAGGPVSPASAVALLQSPSPVAGARAVVDGVHVISTRELLERTLTTPADPNRFRVYLGRSGWGAGQLERETQSGAWHVFAADADLVFDSNPATLWRRLIQRTELQMASVNRGVSSIP
jgi:putative transcriptional regulator